MVTRRTVVQAGMAALLAGPVVASATPARAEAPADRDALRRALDNVVANGASAALLEFRDASGTWRGASGVTELGEHEPAPVAGRFRVGSITKTFVSTVVLQLVGEGRLRLTDSVQRWLPGLLPGGREITLRHLLQHTSGLYNYTDDLFVSDEEFLRNRFRTYRPRELVAIANRHDPLFPPGTRWSYSNTNYIVLGLVVERVTGRPYGASVAQRILRPLSLEHTWSPGVIPAIPGPHAHGYLPVVRNGQTVPVDVTALNPSVAWAAGEMISTTRDLNRFYGGLLSCRLLSPALLREMKTIAPEGQYGLGLQRIALPDGRELWGHTGGIPGYLSVSLTSDDAVQRLTLSINPWGPGDLFRAVNELLLAAFMPGAAARQATTLLRPSDLRL